MDEIIELGLREINQHSAADLSNAIGGDRQRRYGRFILAVLGSIPWIGGFLAATASLGAEQEQAGTNELQREWLRAHRDRIDELRRSHLSTNVRMTIMVHTCIATPWKMRPYGTPTYMVDARLPLISGAMSLDARP